MRKNDLMFIIDYYGELHQEDKLIEELGELTTAIIKYRQGNNSIFDVINEIADVYILLEQYCLIHSIRPNTLKEEQDYKITRTIENIIDKKNNGVGG